MPEPTLEEAQAEIERLKALADVHAQSALLQSVRASALEQEVRRRAGQVQTMQSSTMWRLTVPLRVSIRLATRGPSESARLLRRTREVIAEEGLRPAIAKVRRRVRRALPQAAPPGLLTAEAVYAAPLAAPAADLLAQSVLIVAELSLPQCAKYRVWQKQAHFARLGVPCTVLSWTNLEACRSALQTHSVVIFYRIAGTKPALALIAEAKRLQVTSYWEADDLIFDMAHYLANRNLDTLKPSLRREVLAGVELFRAAMLACDRTIASTESLGRRMAEAGAGPCTVIENALDAETLEIAAGLRERPHRADGAVVIAYGSGSKAHDADFATAAPALAAVLRGRPNVRLRLIGDLQLPADLAEFTGRIERLPATSYAAYLGLLAEANISLAPLEATAFNDAKSNIKYIEASILGLPSICSPRENFRAVIGNGENGFLADAEAEWQRALEALVDSPELRVRIGANALASVLRRYAPDAVTEQQVRPLVAGWAQPRKAPLRVLVVNVFFAPISYGGATVVAEEMVTRLHAMPDTEVCVFTSQIRKTAPPASVTRYDWNGVPVIAVKTPDGDSVADFDNPQIGAIFADVLAAVRPDVVHFHCVQELGASMLRTCQEAGVPYVVTLHDPWWLCVRQFMVTEDDNYCFQTRIDLSVCQTCAPWALHLRPRMQLLLQALAGADLVLSPSETHRQLYLANGLPPDQVKVHYNGVRMPERPRSRRGGPGLRFGFVGGITGLKGFHVVRKAFAAVGDSNYTLVLVDNTLKRGFSSVEAMEWNVAGAVEVVPAYAQEELDAFFDGLDVLLFPSQWKESFGLIVGEALARDVWVIATDGIGAAEFIVEGENGNLIPLTSDPVPLQRAVEALLAHPERLRGHVNRYKDRLRSYDQQAAELHGFLAGVTAQRQDDRPLPALPAY